MLERCAAAHCGRQSAFIEVIEFTADRHAMGEPRHLRLSAVKEVGDVMGGALSLDSGAERQDYFLDRRAARPLDEGIDRMQRPGDVNCCGGK